MNLPKLKDINFINFVLILLALIQYYLLTPLNYASEKYITVSMGLDAKITRIPAILIFYYSVYLLIIFSAVLMYRRKNKSDFTVFLYAMVILWSLVNFFHGYFPVLNNIRPVVTGEGFFFDAVQSLYNSVKPYNTFPSWHAATGILCALFYFKMKFRRFYLILIWVVFISLSPVFLKMGFIADLLLAIPLPFLSYYLAEKLSTVRIKTETVQEVVKSFTLESLIQSVAIGIRDESTLSSLIDNLTRIEKNLTDKDRQEISRLGAEINPPVNNLKDVINELIHSINVEKHIEKANEMFGKDNKDYTPAEKELIEASEELINIACRPFDNPKFRYSLIQIKNRNREIINTSSIEEAAKERSQDIISKFKIFIDSHKKDLNAIKVLSSSKNGHQHITFNDIKEISRELRKPPYEISPDEIWNAFYRIESDRVKPLKEEKNPANLISLTEFAVGKIDLLEPFSDKVDRAFQKWVIENETQGRKFNDMEMEWLQMMKNHISSFLEINMLSFNNPPFVNKGGAAKAYNIFGPDLNRILYELNEKLV